MKIIVLRHATRQRKDRVSDEFIEKSFPLDPIGKCEARERGADLAGRGIKPAVYFTSCFAHARETGEILRDTVGGNPAAKVVELCTLTPHYQGPRELRGKWQGIQILQAIDRESKLTGNDLGEITVVGFVLHQPGLQQLVASMTSEEESRFENIAYSEGVCLRADSLDVFLEGKGEVDEFLRCRR